MCVSVYCSNHAAALLPRPLLTGGSHRKQDEVEREPQQPAVDSIATLALSSSSGLTKPHPADGHQVVTNHVICGLLALFRASPSPASPSPLGALRARVLVGGFLHSATNTHAQVGPLACLSAPSLLLIGLSPSMSSAVPRWLQLCR